MPINISTVYTQELLLKFNDHVAKSGKLVWVIIILCNIISAGCCALIIALGGEPLEITKYLLYILAIDIIWLLFKFVLPRFFVRKDKSLNAMVEFTFEEDCFHIHCTSTYGTESATLQYAILKKAENDGNTLYLMLSRYRGYLVDIGTLNAEQLLLLRGTLEHKLGVKKVKW